MGTSRTTEPAFNIVLADALRCRHPQWRQHINAEQTGIIEGSAGLRPDILIAPTNSSPVIVETEYHPARTVEPEARQRLGAKLSSTGQRIEHVFAVRIPSELSSESQDKIRAGIDAGMFEYCIFSLRPDMSQDRWPKDGWIHGGIDDLATSIEASTISETLLAASTDELERGVAQSAAILQQSSSQIGDQIAEKLCQEAGEQTNRMAMAIIANALIFHSRIEGQQGIPTLVSMQTPAGILGRNELVRCWKWIVQEINYWPIFHIASDLLSIMPAQQASGVLSRLMTMTDALIAMGATRINDLSGRAFQTLIADRKFLATFYTLPASATLLAELAISRLDIDWRSRDEVTALRIADFACGTGALLNAAYHSICSRYRRAGNDDADIHASMIESSLHGFDIMPSATHLTASTLSNTHPGLTYGNTRIITMPYGINEKSNNKIADIGSLNMIADENATPLFSLELEGLSGTADGGIMPVDVPHSSMDVVIMNPPFTRATGQEAEKIGVPVPSFAGFGTTKIEQTAMSGQLKAMYKLLPERAGHGNAGLSSNFIDLAHAKLKPGGVLAMVLQATFAQGSGWSKARNLLTTRYEDIAVMSIANTGTTNYAFSADTGMGEVLVVARKKMDKSTGPGKYLFANLQRRPVHHVAAIEAARSIEARRRDGRDGTISLGDKYHNGSCISSDRFIGGCVGLVESGLAKFIDRLSEGELKPPRELNSIPLPLVKLGELGDRGLYHMDISGKEITGSGLPRGPFDIVPLEGVPTWPVLWSHNAANETKLIVMPDSQGRARSGCDRKAVEAWRKTASCLHFNRDFRVNSQPLAACITPSPTLGGRAWPNFRCADKRWDRLLVLWANTTLGIMAFWWIGTRQQQGRPSLSISKLPSLTVLDVRCMTEKQMHRAEYIFEEYQSQKFLPANEAWHDETRIALDNAMFDLLGVPAEIRDGFDLIRRQWCNEPSVHGGKKSRVKI